MPSWLRRSALAKPVFLLGECRTEYDDKINSSFCSPSGIELLRMLSDAGQLELTPADQTAIADFYSRGEPRYIDGIWHRHRDEFYRSNVFNIHPPANRLEWFCGPKAGGVGGYPSLMASKYVRAEFQPELDRLGDELLAVDPNLIVALGNTAFWALCGRTGVSKLRGTTTETTHLVSGFKIMPTYHPAAVFRQWELRPTTIIDLAKAGRENAFPEVRRPACEIWIEPTLADIRTFIHDHIRGCPILSVDIETSGNRITCIGFAPTEALAIVIPLDDERSATGSYWPTLADERECWKLIAGVLKDPSIPKLFQNGLYDIAFLWRAQGIGVRGAKEDTMLLQHALQPEALKGLGYLGSLYTDFGAWKVDHKNSQTIKRDN